jgi:hypothetical protein
MKKDSLTPAWFRIWFIASCLLLFTSGVIDIAEGGGQIGFNPWGAALALFAMYVLIWVLWKYDILASWVSRLPVPLVVLSVITGWLFAEIKELIDYSFNPSVPGGSLAEDILLTTPMYIGAHLMWFWVLRRYRFTVFQALLTGGLSLGIDELIFGSSTSIAILIFPFLVMIHGVHMVVPKLALSEKLERFDLKDSKMKYIFGIILPALGTRLALLVVLLFAS